ncbi:MAG: F0F1 ATP synthase subunit delta [Thermosipho sp. (in: Bacteria)]|nr:F0F1 ATP synthase subunit delta [Thermosipho sp. (in: thermotogales)]
MRYSIVASKYVRALLNIAKKFNKVEEYQVLFEVLNGLYSNFSSFLNNPTEKLEKKLYFINLAFQEILKNEKKIAIDEIFQSFIKIVFRNKRQRYIPQMMVLYKYAAIESENKIPVKVISATKLSVEEEKMLEEFVEKYVNRKPVFEEEIDESLIAGVIIEFAGQMLDVSVKGRLEKIGREVFSLRKG